MLKGAKKEGKARKRVGRRGEERRGEERREEERRGVVEDSGDEANERDEGNRNKPSVFPIRLHTDSQPFHC